MWTKTYNIKEGQSQKIETQDDIWDFWIFIKSNRNIYEFSFLVKT